MELLTHALTSLAFARTIENRLPRFGTAMIVVAGVAPDLDYASYFGGAAFFLRVHRTLLHSIFGGAILTCAIAAAFCYLDRKRPPKKSAPPLRFGPALAACALGFLSHLLLDFASGEGIQALWVFHGGWQAWDLLADFDPWILLLLLAGLLLPPLFKLVSEEIGDRRKTAGAQRGAVVALVLVFLFIGARAWLHSRAMELLLSNEYHRRAPLTAGAFPHSTSPFEWRGVVSTENTIEEIQISLAPGAPFDPDRSLSHFKPEPSPALDAGQRTRAASLFLSYARFPLARTDHREDAYRFVLRDARFLEHDPSPANVWVFVDFDSSLQIRREHLAFGGQNIR
ncbi:MAG TPA: metal-dependent hydrolase [Candidatus Limnocylindrales bacterium]|nr:metal-dependent hydrolase [Candidatus Limnocylindrales bacterium]